MTSRGPDEDPAATVAREVAVAIRLRIAPTPGLVQVRPMRPVHFRDPEAKRKRERLDEPRSPAQGRRGSRLCERMPQDGLVTERQWRRQS